MAEKEAMKLPEGFTEVSYSDVVLPFLGLFCITLVYSFS